MSRSSVPRAVSVRCHGRIVGTLAALALALCTLVWSQPSLAQSGLVLHDLRGETFSEADLTRGPSIVVIWASWSPRGRDVVARVNALHRKWSSKGQVLTVNFQEDRATIEQFTSEQSFQVPVLMDTDGAFAKKYAVTSLPGLLVFRDGQRAFGGRLPDDPDRVLAEIFP